MIMQYRTSSDNVIYSGLEKLRVINYLPVRRKEYTTTYYRTGIYKDTWSIGSSQFIRPHYFNNCIALLKIVKNCWIVSTFTNI